MAEEGSRYPERARWLVERDEQEARRAARPWWLKASSAVVYGIGWIIAAVLLVGVLAAVLNRTWNPVGG